MYFIKDFKNGTPTIFQRSNLNKSSRRGNELTAAVVSADTYFIGFTEMFFRSKGLFMSVCAAGAEMQMDTAPYITALAELGNSRCAMKTASKIEVKATLLI